MPESLLAILKLCAVALLYLFFLRVLRAVWAEVSPAKATAAPASKPARPARRSPARRPRTSSSPELRVVEPAELAGQRWPLGDELTVGRASGCTVTIEDSYASQLHLRLFRQDGGVHVEDLGSTNGTYVNGKKVTAAVAVGRGDQIRVGTTVFEVNP